jgi:hypothetical protein
MSRARHLIPVMAAGALAGLVAWPAEAAPATANLKITATSGSQIERVGSRHWREDDASYGYRRNHGDDGPYRYRYRYRYGLHDYPYWPSDDDRPYRYRYYDDPYRYGGYGIYAPRFGDGRRGDDRD